jgi:hypothetical protein
MERRFGALYFRGLGLEVDGVDEGDHSYVDPRHGERGLP